MKPTRLLPAEGGEPATSGDKTPRGRIVSDLPKTRHLGPELEQANESTMIGQPLAVHEQTDATAIRTIIKPTCGWLVVIAGSGLGASFTVVAGMNAVGQGSGPGVTIDLRDDSLSEGVHIFLAYDQKTGLFHANHAGQAALVRLNDAPLLSPTTLSAGDRLVLETMTLAFVPFCGPDFDWNAPPSLLDKAE